MPQYILELSGLPEGVYVAQVDADGKVTFSRLKAHHEDVFNKLVDVYDNDDDSA